MTGSDPFRDAFAFFVELQAFVAWFSREIVRLEWPSVIVPEELGGRGLRGR